MSQDAAWPFDQERNVAAFTLKRIIWSVGGMPRAAVLYVTHDADDHGWQFLDGNDVTQADAAIVSMEEMLELDPTLREIADLPPGWIAVREEVGGRWTRLVREEGDGKVYS